MSGLETDAGPRLESEARLDGYIHKGRELVAVLTVSTESYIARSILYFEYESADTSS